MRKFNERPGRAIVESLEHRQLLAAITSGQTIASSISSAGELDTYTFNLSAGQTFSLTMAENGSDFYPAIDLYDPNAAKIDGTWDYTTAAVLSRKATIGGTYTVIARDRDVSHTGAYNLTFLRFPGAQAADPDGHGGAISSGQTKAGSVNRPGDLDVYTFSANANDTFTITLAENGSDFDPEFDLYAPSGGRITSTWDYTTAAVISQAAASSGTYSIVARDRDVSNSGAYNLTFVKFPGATVADPDGQGGAIASGQTKAASISRAGDLDVYTFTANAHDKFSITLAENGSDFYPEFDLYAPNGARITSTWDYTSAAVISQDASTAGTYTIVARDRDVSNSGAYNLTFVKFPATQVADPEGHGGAISSGQTKSGAVNRAGDLDVYTFEMSANETFSVTLAENGSDFYPELDLYGPSGNRITSVWDYTTAAILSQEAEASGTYSLVARDRDVSNAGAYNLTFYRFPGTHAADPDGNGGTIGSGDVKTGSINRAGDIDVFTFGATTGDNFSLTLAENGSDFYPQLELYGPNGQRISSTWDYTTAAILSKVAASTGTYSVVARDRDVSNTGAYKLTLGGVIHPPPVTNPTITVAVTDANASEPGSDTGKFTFTRTGSTSASLAVKYTLAGSATNGTDYNTLNGSVTILAGAATATVTVTPKDDLLPEAKETVIATLAAGSGYTIGSAKTATVSIADNEPTPTIGSAEMVAYRPQIGAGSYSPLAKTAVSEADETSVLNGPGIRINGDDDNANQKPDRDDTAISSENDLIEVNLRGRGGNYVLERFSPTLRVWSTRTKTAGTEIAFTNNKTNVVLTSTPTLYASRTVWVEWSQAAHGTASLRLRPAVGQPSNLPQDSITFHTFQSIVVALGGLGQVAGLPLDANHGAFKIGTSLYQSGYDVRLFDEDKVTSDGTGLPYNEIKTATQPTLGRGVSQVAIFGYSRGGGATFDLVNALYTKLQIKARVTGYMDAIKSSNAASEIRRPTQSQFHINYYQTKRSGLALSAGAPTTGLLGTDVQQNISGTGIDHFNVDDDARTQSGFLTNIKAKLLR
jgi:hypothetical protein